MWGRQTGHHRLMPCDARVLILQPEAGDDPAFLATFLRERGVPFEVRCPERGDEVPGDLGAWTHVAMLGGAMSVNDPLLFLAQIEALLRQAVAKGVPVIGHCLGGQMLAKVLGATVQDHPEPEIGWSRVQCADHPLARAWFGEEATWPAFQWHFQSFGLPPGATLLAGTERCAHQAFAHGPHLGMQFHIEVDAEKLCRWRDELPREGDPLLRQSGVQTAAEIEVGNRRWLAQSQAVAGRIYRRWLGWS